MADIDIERAENLMKSARYLISQDDLAGVAGLAYQAFESAVISLTSVINGSDSRTHAARRERAKALLSNHRANIDLLWEVRNVDFYGNTHLYQPRRKLTKEEAVDALNTVEIIITDIKQMLRSRNP
jgi:HEPN domain-containing protein